MMKKLILMPALLTWLAAGAGITAANATAMGLQQWDVTTVTEGPVTVTYPKGVLYHRIDGDGYYVKSDSARADALGNLCDASIRFTYGDGTRYIKSNVKLGCFHDISWGNSVNNSMPRGSACAELWVHNWKHMLTKQCHYIEG